MRARALQLHSSYQLTSTIRLFAAVWTPLLPSLPTSVRFLAYNQRSYAQSSPASSAKEVGGVDATAQYLCDLMNFVQWAIDSLHLPALDEQTQEGGIVLMVRLDSFRPRR